MTSTISTVYQGNIEGKLISSITTATTTGITVKVKKVNNATPTWPTAIHRLRITQRTGTQVKVECVEVAAGTTQSGQTVTLGTLTRAFPLNDGTTFSGTGTAQSFAAGADVFFAWDEHDAAQTLKADIVNTITGAGSIRGSSTTVANLRPNSMTTTQRDAIASPGNGDIIYNSSTSVMNQYIGGAWTTFATGTIANAANTSSGKVDIATAAEIAAATATDATSGALNALTVGVTAVNAASGNWASGAIPALNTAKMVDGSMGGTGVASPVLGALLIGGGAGLAMTPIGPGSNGQVPLSNGTTLAMGAAPVYTKAVFTSSTLSADIGNATTDTAFDTHTYTISANDLIAGVIYEFEVFATATHGASNSFNLGLKLGSNVRVSSTSANSSGAPDEYSFRGRIGGNAAAGAAASVRCWIQGYNNSGFAYNLATNNEATNGSIVITFTGKFGSSSGGNGAQIRSSNIVKISSTAF